MIIKRILLVLWVFAVVSPGIFAAEYIELNSGMKSLNIGTYLDILEDNENSLTIESVSLNSNSDKLNWNHAHKSAVGFGFTKSAYWIRFKVNNSTNKVIKWLLNQEYPLIDHLQVFIPKPNGDYEQIHLGDYQNFSERPIIDKTFVIPLTTAPNSQATYYLRYATSSSMNISLKIWIPEAFEEYKNTELPLLWMFYGIFAVMFAFNLIVLIYTRETAYFYYILYIAAFGLLMMSLNGIAFQYLWPTSIWWANICSAIFISVTIFSLVQFARHMIQIGKHSCIIDFILKIIVVCSLVIIVITFITDSYRFGIIAATALTGIASTLGIYFGMYLAFSKKHRVREALFFFVAFSFFLIGILLFVLKTFSILPINFITTYAIQIGASFEIILLSLILPDRVNILKEELTVLNENLEDQVRQRTAQLNIAQEKLLSAAHNAGMADMARDTMHSIGNIVNSMNISIERLESSDEAASIIAFKQANQLLRQNINNLDEFVLKDPKAKKLMEFYLEIENGMADEQDTIKNSIRRISEKIREIINVIAAQQEYVDEAYFMEVSILADLIEDILDSQQQKIEHNGIVVVKNFQEIPKVLIQTRKLNFIISSLVLNAIQAMSQPDLEEKKLILSLYTKNGNICFKIQDTGVGIPKGELKKIFRHGYSYHQIGKGLGLHSCGNYASEMKGRIWAESDGENKGATFFMELPINQE